MAGSGHKLKVVLTLLAVLGLSAAGLAQVRLIKSFRRDMEISRRADKLEVSASFPEIFTQRFRHRLSSGFTSLILVEVVLRTDRRKAPLVHRVVHYSILYDIWEERFNVRVESPTRSVQLQLRYMNQLIDTCGKIQNLSLAPIPELEQGKRYQIRVRITVNPTSPALRRKVREYLANPDGLHQLGSPRSFFGSFSKIFVSEKDIQADAVYTYQSQRFRPPSER